MWWLLPIAAGAAAIWKLLSDDERAARQRWQTTQESVQRSIEDHKRNIERKLADAESPHDFHALTDLHYSSARVADHAYGLLRDAKKSLHVMGIMLQNAKQVRDEAKQALLTTHDPERRAALNQKITSAIELRTAMFPDKDIVKAQRDAMKAELAQLNARTRDLKLAIRDRCGVRGQDWYARLEARSAQRRAG